MLQSMLRTRKNLSILFFYFIFTPIILRAQVERCVLTGVVKDNFSKETILGAAVFTEGNETSGVLSDVDGKYTLNLMPGKRKVIFRMIGYDTQELVLEILPNELKVLNIELKSNIKQLKTFVTTAGKYEQNIEQLTVSMEVLKPNIIENKNTTSINDALQQVPGVSIVNNEPQIRSGSGFSFGAGSRVMILIDGLPILSGDAGRPSWGFIPTENVEQVEVIKGASSVLYGSAALSGVINIRTAYPRDTPQTKINVFSGLYNNPRNRAAIYWGENNPTYTGLNFFHSRKIGQFDIVIGGNLFNDNGYKGPSPVNILDTTFNPLAEQRGEFENRARINANLRWRSKKLQGLTAGVNVNAMLSRSAQALLWLNPDSGMYRAYPGSLTQTLQDVYYVDPFVEYVGKKGFRHSLKNRFFHLNNNNDNNQSNKSDLFYSEYQLQKQIQKGFLKSLTINAGVVHQLTKGVSDLYKGNISDSITAPASSSNRNIAAFVQLEKTFFERLTISAGARYEHFSITSPRINLQDSAITSKEGKPVFRAGANLKIHKATFLRVSFGEGYRFPTIAEKFIKTAVGPIRIYPNDSLKSESSWNAEIGIKQGFKIGNFLGYLDIAVFRQKFEDNIEFNFGQFGTFADPLFGLGFGSLNIGRTQVTGIDGSIMGYGKIGKTQIALLAGYTYSNPISLEKNLPYPIKSLDNKFVTYAGSSSDSTGNLLKYRLQHLLKTDIELTRGKWSAGLSVRYNSFMKNIDKIFVDLDTLFVQVAQLTGATASPLPGLGKYRAANNKGVYVADLRISYQLSKGMKLAVIINNLLNEEYTIRPMVVEKPRTTAVQFSMDF
jgi:iron complex outermembrane receptor protein